MKKKARRSPYASPKPSPVPEAQETLLDKESPLVFYPGRHFPKKRTKRG
jgi:hypothetical protein